MDDIKPIEVHYDEPTQTPTPLDVKVESIFGKLPQVTTTPTWTPRRFMDGMAFNTTTGQIFYYDFTNNIWKSVAGGGGGAMLTCNIATFTMNFGDTKFVDLSGIGTVVGDLGNLVTRIGSLRNLHIGMKSNTVNGTSTFVIYKNGTNTTLTTTVSASSTTTASDVTHNVTVAAGDKITMQVNTAGSSGTIVFGFSYELN